MRHCSGRTENLSCISAGIIVDYDTSAKRPVVCAPNATRQGQNLKHVFLSPHHSRQARHLWFRQIISPPSVNDCQTYTAFFQLELNSAVCVRVFAAAVPPLCTADISRGKVADVKSGRADSEWWHRGGGGMRGGALLHLFPGWPQQLIYGELTKQLRGFQQQDSSCVCISDMH